MNQSLFCVVCLNLFLSTVEIILIVVVYLFDPIVLETSSIFWIRNQSGVFVVFQSRFCVFCLDMFLSNSEVIIFLVYFFDPVFIETSLVRWISNQSRFFVRIFDYMEDPWLCVLNTMDQK